MTDANYTGSMVSEFVIVGFPGLQDRESKAILFAVFLTVYLLILLGNLFLICILAADRSLHTPMYLTICSLAIIDIASCATTVPTMLAVFRSTSYTVSFSACFTQTYFFMALLTIESFILLLMPYDRYVAICRPLQYSARMTILLSVLRISNSAGRAKAVSTCSSHLLVLSMFFLTTAGVFISYRIPGTSVDMRVMESVIQHVFPALMNPTIYCLRTKEIRDSLVKTLKKGKLFPGSK
ncbi:olfactory receptor 11H6-like [Amia ocellicauda]|uniref:olfactory receptor 11H6-like n=1 Tax=Amia ocellicauda TaxID=2972642 RepID=UPI003463F141